jgi:nucleoid-associated protein YgaU
MRDDALVRTSVGSSVPSQGSELRPSNTVSVTGHHIAARGETFETIARVYYGSDSYSKSLWWANRNRVAWPQALKAGDKIDLPPVDRLEIPSPAAKKSSNPREFQSAPSQSAPPAHFPPQAAEPARPQRHFPRSDRRIEQASTTAQANLARKTRSLASRAQTRAPFQSDALAPTGGYAIHVVKPQETLSSIARVRLGDESRGQEIAKLNQDLLGPTGQLTPGQRLLLPAGTYASQSIP